MREKMISGEIDTDNYFVLIRFKGFIMGGKVKF